MWWIRILILLGGFLVICVIGFAKQLININQNSKEASFLNEYRNRFIDFVLHKNPEAYHYLFQNFRKAAYIMGADGMMGKLHLPFENGYHLNVHVLSILSQVLEGSLPGGEKIIDEAILRAHGWRSELHTQLVKKILNPFCDFYVGLNWIIMMPFIILSYLLTGKNRINNSGFLVVVLRVFASIIQALAILSSIITVVVGWEEFVKIVNNIF